MDNTILIYNTVPNEETAQKIAEELVGRQLAACVSMVPGLRSVYRWQGKVEQATEVCLMIKTTVERLEALQAELLSLHPYTVPEIIAVPITGGLPAYLQWIVDETASSGAK